MSNGKPSIIDGIRCVEAFAKLFSPRTPTPAPAPMTASRLRKLMEETTPGPWEAQFSKDWSRVVIGTPERVIVLRGFAGNYENEANDQMLVAELVTAAPTILRLLEAVEGMEKDRTARDQLCALTLYGWAVEKRSLYDEEGVEGWVWIDHNGAEYYEIGDWDEPPPWPDSAAAALATLRAAREGAR